MSNRLPGRIILAPALLLSAGLLWHGWLAAANTPTVTVELTATAIIATPTSTPIVASPELPTASPTIAPVPEVSGESSTPIATIALPSTMEPTPTPAPAHQDVAPTATSTPRPVTLPTATFTSSAAASAVAISAPMPSPADLRLDARLRWGTHVPASVRQWAYLIVPAARRYHLNPNLLAAVMTMESDGDPLAWSSADARGLMQVLHGPWDPRVNVFTGARMLAEYYDEFHDWSLALAAYNAGPGAVIGYGGIPPYRETRDYVIIVEYLFDLFDHHHLSHRRTQEYRSSLVDLERFADQRQKVPRLAAVAKIRIIADVMCRHFSFDCAPTTSGAPVMVQDPFWPVGNTPDPLQKVDPFAQPAG